MDKHVNFICRSANYNIRALCHVRSTTSAEVANNIACAIVGARLDYCNPLLLGTSKTNVVKPQHLQNSTAWVVTRTCKFDSITAVLMRLHWLPIQSRIQYKFTVLTCMALQSGQPEYLSSLLQWHEPTHILRLSARQHLIVPEDVWTAFASCAFSCAAPEIWNSLSPDVIDAFMSNSVACFKSHLKTHLYRQSFSK